MIATSIISLFMSLSSAGIKTVTFVFLRKTEVVGSKYLSYFSDFSFHWRGLTFLFLWVWQAGCENPAVTFLWVQSDISSTAPLAASAQRSLRVSFILLSVFLKTKPNSQLDHIKIVSILLWLSPLLWPSLQSSQQNNIPGSSHRVCHQHHCPVLLRVVNAFSFSLLIYS